MQGYCTECTYRTKEHDRKRDVSEEVEKAGGKVAIYMMKDSTCPQCQAKGTIKFKFLTSE